MSLTLRVWRMALVSMIVILECCVLGYFGIGLWIFSARVKDLEDAAVVFGPLLSLPLLLVTIWHLRGGTIAYWVMLISCHFWIAAAGGESSRVFVGMLRMFWPFYAIGILLMLLILATPQLGRVKSSALDIRRTPVTTEE